VRRIDLRRSEGVAMTEFALILPVFILIVAGLLGFGRVFFYWISANSVIATPSLRLRSIRLTAVPPPEVSAP